MTDATDEGSPRTLARLTGALYLYIMVAAMFAEAFVRDKLVVPGNGPATAHNIAASASLWRWGVAADVSTTLCDVAVAALLYILLRPVSRAGAVSAACFRLAYAAAMAVNAIFLLAPLFLLRDLSSISASQAQSLMMYSLRLHDAGFSVALALFGVHLVVIGVLIAKSRFLPQALGLALAMAGGCYITNSFVSILAPDLASRLFPWILLPGFLAEAVLTIWLLIVGLNPARWSSTRLAPGV